MAIRGCDGLLFLGHTACPKLRLRRPAEPHLGIFARESGQVEVESFFQRCSDLMPSI